MRFGACRMRRMAPALRCRPGSLLHTGCYMAPACPAGHTRLSFGTRHACSCWTTLSPATPYRCGMQWRRPLQMWDLSAVTQITKNHKTMGLCPVDCLACTLICNHQHAIFSCTLITIPRHDSISVWHQMYSGHFDILVSSVHTAPYQQWLMTRDMQLCPAAGVPGFFHGGIRHLHSAVHGCAKDVALSHGCSVVTGSARWPQNAGQCLSAHCSSGFPHAAAGPGDGG